MTNEEAIEILEELWRYNTTDKFTDDEIRKSLDLAIKALEQQPCEEEDTNCTECRYYDKEKHYCPRFCRVIKDTIAEITLKAESEDKE